MKRVHNFSAGPAALPLEVLEIAQAEMLDYHSTGTSIMEVSHRGKEYMEVDAQATASLKRILGLGEDFEILYLTGGASSQFMQVPLNFLSKNEEADYINTGVWSTKAIKEAKIFGKVNEIFSSEKSNFDRVPTSNEYKVSDNARYLHYTSNNTIYGTQFESEPESNGIPLVCDSSSDFLSRPIDVSKHGIIYAGAQKNLGPAGVTVVIIKKEFLEKANKNDLPTILNYKTHLGVMFNTPPTYPIYLVSLVLDWIEKKGGVDFFEKYNAEKSQKLYSEIDKDGFYSGTAEYSSRSKMNVCFTLPSLELEDKFVEEAEANELMGLRGHRTAGGIRASIYNACTQESVDALISFMAEFRRKNG